MEQQYEFVEKAIKEGEVKELCILYNTSKDKADAWPSASLPAQQDTLRRNRPILGTHGGPNMLGVCLLGKLTK